MVEAHEAMCDVEELVALLGLLKVRQSGTRPRSAAGTRLPAATDPFPAAFVLNAFSVRSWRCKWSSWAARWRGSRCCLRGSCWSSTPGNRSSRCAVPSSARSTKGLPDQSPPLLPFCLQEANLLFTRRCNWYSAMQRQGSAREEGAPRTRSACRCAWATRQTPTSPSPSPCCMRSHGPYPAGAACARAGACSGPHQTGRRRPVSAPLGWLHTHMRRGSWGLTECCVARAGWLRRPQPAACWGRSVRRCREFPMKCINLRRGFTSFVSR